MRDAAAVLGAAVAADGLDAVAAAPEELAQGEDERVLANLTQPSEDQVPQVLQQGAPEQVATGGTGNRLRRSGNSEVGRSQ